MIQSERKTVSEKLINNAKRKQKGSQSTDRCGLDGSNDDDISGNGANNKSFNNMDHIVEAININIQTGAYHGHANERN